MEWRIRKTKSGTLNLWSHLDILPDMVSEDEAESKVKQNLSRAVLPTEASPPPSLFPDTPSRLFETPIGQHSSETNPPEVLMYDLRKENERLKEERDKLDQEYHHLVLTNNELPEDIKFYKTKAEMIEEAYQTLIKDGMRFQNQERTLNVDSNNSLVYEASEKAWEKAWNSWEDHGFPMLYKSMGKHGIIFQATSAEHGYQLSIY